MPEEQINEIEEMISELGGDAEPAAEQEPEEPHADEPADSEIVEEVQDDEPEEEPEEDPGEARADGEEEDPEPRAEVEEKEERDEKEEALGTEDEEDDEVIALRAQVEAASEALLRAGIAMPGTIPPAQPAQPAAAPTAPVKGQTLEEFAILEEDVDFDDVMNDRETFITTMRNILGRYRQMLGQDLSRSIPNVVANQVQRVSALKGAVDSFYQVHEDLLPVRKTVGAVANQVVAEHPDWDLTQVFNEAAVRTRKVMRMKTPKGSKVVKPSFAKSKGKGRERKPKPKVSKLQQEIDDVLD